MEGEREPTVNLPVFTRPRLLIGFVVGCVLLSAAAFVVGLQIRSPADVSVPIVDSVGPTYAKAERRVVGDIPTAAGTVANGGLVSLDAPAVPGADRLVVQEVSVRRGEVVRSGDMIAIISGRPVLLLRLAVPMFRSLHPGDQGRDVAEVQRALRDLDLYNGGINGVFNSSTQQAIARLYGSRGLLIPPPSEDAIAELGAARKNLAEALAADGDGAPTVHQLTTLRKARSEAEFAAGAWLPIDDVAAITKVEATVVSVARKGAVLTAGESSVALLQMGAMEVRARVDVVSKPSFAVRTPVKITLPGISDVTFSGVVLTVSAFRDSTEASAAEIPGYDIVVGIRSGPVDQLSAKQSVQLTPRRGGSRKSSLAVPLVAVRQDSVGSYLLVVNAQGVSERVNVVVLQDSGGWAALAEDSGVAVGNRVQVTP